MVEIFANNRDPDQTPRSAASDLGLHCLPVALLGVSRLQWVKINNPGLHNVLDRIHRICSVLGEKRMCEKRMCFSFSLFAI